jgi:aminoglycoside-2''-adenylyltransferase
MPNLLEEFRTVVRVLDEARIPYAVCGGIALSIHANPRATVDIDLLAPPDAVGKIVEALEPHGFVRRERTPTRLAAGEVVMHRLAKIVPGDPDVLVLDVIEVRPGATGAAWRTRTSGEWEGRSLTVVSRAGLIGLKKLRGSPQDVADIAALGGESE